MPFQTDPNTGFGILLKTYVAALSFHFDDQVTAENMDTEAAKKAKKEALVFVDQSFSSVKDPMREVERGFRFWSAVSLSPYTCTCRELTAVKGYGGSAVTAGGARPEPDSSKHEHFE